MGRSLKKHQIPSPPERLAVQTAEDAKIMLKNYPEWCALPLKEKQAYTREHYPHEELSTYDTIP